MRTSNITFMGLLALTLAKALSAADELEGKPPTGWDSPPPPAVPLQNCENRLDVPYSVKRKTGTDADQNHLLNIHIPKGPGPFPCVIFLHGGGYIGGHKDYTFYGSSQPYKGMPQRMVDAGFVCVNANYPVGRGIRSQAWWEFRTMIRYLRAHAAELKINPGRIATWGFSAGGWLSSSAGCSTADDSRTVHLGKTQDSDPEKRKGPKFLFPMDDARGEWLHQSSRVSAIAADLWENTEEFFSPDDPLLIGYMGRGAKEISIAADAAKGKVPLTVLEVEFKPGQTSVHMPPATAPVVNMPGKVLQDAVFDWMVEALQKNPRSIPPEARPNLRIFRETVQVSLIPPAPDAIIRYSADGQPVTEQSPQFTEPFAITRTTTIHAKTFRKGESTSPEATFTFTKGTPPPEIILPEGPQLPVAKVGQPYAVTFTSSTGADTAWNLTGHLELTKKGNDKGALDRTGGIRFDHEKGILSGTPKNAGSFLIQIQAATKKGGPADARSYVLVIQR